MSYRASFPAWCRHAEDVHGAVPEVAARAPVCVARRAASRPDGTGGVVAPIARQDQVADEPPMGKVWQCPAVFPGRVPAAAVALRVCSETGAADSCFAESCLLESSGMSRLVLGGRRGLWLYQVPGFILPLKKVAGKCL